MGISGILASEDEIFCKTQFKLFLNFLVITHALRVSGDVFRGPFFFCFLLYYIYVII